MKKNKLVRFLIPALSVGFILGLSIKQRLPMNQLITKVQALTGSLNVSSTSQTASGDITGQKFVDVGSASYFLDPNASGNSLIVAGNVGIGTTSPVNNLHVNGRSSFGNNVTTDYTWMNIQADQTNSGNDTYRGFRQYLTQSAGGNTNPIIAIDGACFYTAASGNLSGCRAGSFTSAKSSTGTMTNLIGVEGISWIENTGNVTTAILGDFYNYAFTTDGAAATVTTGYGVHAGVKKQGAGSAAATISTGYGVYIDNVDATTNYGLYQADTTADNYFAGNVGIGTATPGVALEVAGQVKISGGTPGAGKVLTSDANGLATWTTPASSYRTLVTLGSDIGSSASTAFQDITGLSFAVTAGVWYRFQVTIYFAASATTVGSRWAVNGPANPTKLAYYARWAISATGISDTNANSYDAGSASTTSFSTTGNIATIHGQIKPSANGTFILRFAPETATANGITVQAGSTLEYW